MSDKIETKHHCQNCTIEISLRDHSEAASYGFCPPCYDSIDRKSREFPSHPKHSIGGSK